MFLVLNASSLTLLPITIFMYRLQQGASDPTAVFLPILLATSASTLAGFLAVALVQRLRLWDPVLLAWLLAIGGGLGLLVAGLAGMTAAALSATSSLAGNLALLSVVALFLLAGAWKRVPVYESFIDGAKQGFEVARDLLPYLVAMLCAIGALRASGAMDAVLDGLRALVAAAGWDTRFVEALPVALMKPFSGSGARALMVETMQTHGVDSFPALLAATFQGSTETTFFVLAVYLGAVGLRRARHALPCALVADLAGFSAAIAVAYLFWA
jgi:spore maturation protein SpmB